MKKLMILTAIAAAMTGCISRNPIAPMDSRVTIAQDLAYDVYVTDVRCTKGTSDFLTFQANLVNNCHDPLAVEWKVQWLDADGMEIESLVSTWDALVIQPNEIRGLKGTAPKSDAADMRFYARKARR